LLSNEPELTLILTQCTPTSLLRIGIPALLESHSQLPDFEILMVCHTVEMNSSSIWASLQFPVGVRIIHLPSKVVTLGAILNHAVKHSRGQQIIGVTRIGQLSVELLLRLFAQVCQNKSSIIVPRLGEDIANSWTYGYELSPDLAIHEITKEVSHVVEVPATAVDCWAGSRCDIMQREGFCDDISPNMWLSAEFSLRWWLSGGTILLDPTVSFRAERSESIGCNLFDLVYGRLKTAYMHLSKERYEMFLCQSKRYFPSKTQQILRGFADQDLSQQRKRWLQTRKYDDEWYAARFGLTLSPYAFL